MSERSERLTDRLYRNNAGFPLFQFVLRLMFGLTAFLMFSQRLERRLGDKCPDPSPGGVVESFPTVAGDDEETKTSVLCCLVCILGVNNFVWFYLTSKVWSIVWD